MGCSFLNKAKPSILENVYFHKNRYSKYHFKKLSANKSIIKKKKKQQQKTTTGYNKNKIKIKTLIISIIIAIKSDLTQGHFIVGINAKLEPHLRLSQKILEPVRVPLRSQAAIA